jgi:glycosyltransferase involved in cell wall biosynthesis
MRKVLIATCYNSCSFIKQAIDSALAQSVAFDTLYVIDDGSTDGSTSVIERCANKNKSVVLVRKHNAGQLSCLNIASTLVNPDDLIWLLDSDDIYPSDYLESMLAVWKPNEAPIAFCERTKFSDEQYCPKSSRISDAQTVRIGSSANLTRVTGCWIGTPTSCIALTGQPYLRILPYQDEEAWRIRADDVLVYGSSLLGAAKLLVPSLTIGKRMHGNNNYAGKKPLNTAALRKRNKAARMLFKHFYGDINISTFSTALAERRMIPAEYRKRFAIHSLFNILTRWCRVAARKSVALASGVDF